MSDALDIEILGVPLRIATHPRLFCPSGVDAGTLAMLERAGLAAGDKALDLGCGCGVVGVYAAKVIGGENVVMSDIDPLAVEVARENAVRNGVSAARAVVSDGFQGIDDTGFTVILSNPPYHADFSVPKRFIEKGFNRLGLNGRMLMVTKRLDWYKNKFTAVFGGVSVTRSGDYFVFLSQKRGTRYFASKR